MAIAKSRILQTLHQMDVAVFSCLANQPSITGYRLLAKWLSRTADGWLYPFIPLVLLPYSPELALDVFYVLAVAYGLERTFYTILKKGFKRNRPPNVIPGFNSVIQASDEFSFPSGHTSAAFLAVTTLVLFLPGTAAVLLFAWSCSIGLSRIVLGVHFPLDTVAGALLGSLTAFAVFQLITPLL